MTGAVLVTGAGGFAGGAIAKALSDAGHEVIALTRSGAFRTDDGGPRWVAGDLSDPDCLGAITGDIGAVVHAAATVDRPGARIDQLVADNILATRNTIAVARRAGARRFIYLSSVSVHGTVASPTVSADTPIIDPNPYGYTKRAGELMLEDIADDMPSVALRLPGIVGPDGHSNWLTRTVQTLAEGRGVTITNPQGAFNNALHINDLATFCLTLLDQPLKSYAAFPLAAAGATTIKNAIQRISDRVGGGPVEVAKGGKAPFTIDDSLARDRYGYRSMAIDDVIDLLCLDIKNDAGALC